VSKRVFWFKRLLSFFLIVLIIAFGVFVIQRQHRNQPESVFFPNKIKVMTYNIHHGVGSDGVYSLSRIAQVIRDEDPQIVCLNEVDYQTKRTFGDDQVRKIADELDMEYSFARNFPLEGGWYGNAILTSFPIHFVENTIYKNHSPEETRGLLHMSLKMKKQFLHIYATHLGVDSLESGAQTTELLSSILKWGVDDPVILAGDFNMEPRYQRIREILYYFKDNGSNLENVFTYPSPNPTKRIDFIFANESMELLSTSVISNSVTALASDHLPVVATYRIHHLTRKKPQTEAVEEAGQE